MSYGGEGAVVGVIAWEQSRVLYKHSHGFQDEGDEELDVDKVPGTAQSPGEETGDTCNQRGL